MSPRPSLRLVAPRQLFDQHLEVAEGAVFVSLQHDLHFRVYAFLVRMLVRHRASMTRFAR